METNNEKIETLFNSAIRRMNESVELNEKLSNEIYEMVIQISNTGELSEGNNTDKIVDNSIIGRINSLISKIDKNNIVFEKIYKDLYRAI